MFKFIKNLFKKERHIAINSDAITVDYTRTYLGHSYEITKEYSQEYGLMEICGWYSGKIREGDVIKINMASGKAGLFIIFKLEKCADPDDMFFATVFSWKYADE